MKQDIVEKELINYSDLYQHDYTNIEYTQRTMANRNSDLRHTIIPRRVKIDH